MTDGVTKKQAEDREKRNERLKRKAVEGQRAMKTNVGALYTDLFHI